MTKTVISTSTDEESSIAFIQERFICHAILETFPAHLFNKIENQLSRNHSKLNMHSMLFKLLFRKESNVLDFLVQILLLSQVEAIEH